MFVPLLPLGSITIGASTGGWGGVPGKRTPPLGSIFLKFACSFWHKSCQIIHFASKPMIGAAVWEILDPPLDLITFIRLIFVQNKPDRALSSKVVGLTPHLVKCSPNQECIPVGCVLSATLAVSPAMHAPTPTMHAPLPCMPPCHACHHFALHVDLQCMAPCPPPCMPPLLTE